MSPRFVGDVNSSLPSLSDISMSETPASNAPGSSVRAEIEKSRDILNDVKVKGDNLSTSLESYRKTQQEQHVAIEGNLIRISRGLFSRLGILERCQNHHFPILFSHVRSISHIVRESANRVGEIGDCQRRYLLAFVTAIIATNVRLDDLRGLAMELLAA